MPAECSTSFLGCLSTQNALEDVGTQVEEKHTRAATRPWKEEVNVERTSLAWR
jgi:hypothetical protein